MIPLLTKGIKHYPDMILPLTIVEEIDLREVLKSKDCYRIVCITSGVGLLNPGKEMPSSVFQGPCVLCLNEEDDLTLRKEHNLKHISVCLHPEIINSRFDYPTLQGDSKDFTESDYQDLFLIAPFLRNKKINPPIISLGPREFLRIKELFSDIRTMIQLQDDFFWPCKSRSYLMELLFLIRQLHINYEKNKQEDVNTPAADELVTRIILYLHTYYYKKVTVKELTREFATNRTTLSRRFKEAVSESLITYLNKIRLRNAGNMLRNTSCPVREIAERVGYGDITHFERLFKRYFGVSPSVYRSRR